MILVWLLAVLAIVASGAHAETFLWNGVTYSEPVGYRLYYGLSSRNYQTVVDTGPTTSVFVGNLTVGRTYYAAVTAYGTVNGRESPFSSELVYTVPLPPDTTLPVVSIQSPRDGSNVTRNSNITISVQASDNVGVTQIKVFVDGKQWCISSQSSVECRWRVPTAAGRTYTISARAMDAAGNVGSASVRVTSR